MFNTDLARAAIARSESGSERSATIVSAPVTPSSARIRDSLSASRAAAAQRAPVAALCSAR